METSKFAVELREIEEKDNVMENAMFQIGCLQKFFKVGVLKNSANFTGRILCWSHFQMKLQSWKSLQLYQKETLAWMFSCEICEFFKNTFF